MSSKGTWLWLCVTAVFLALILAHRHFAPLPTHGPAPILPALKAAQVKQVEVLQEGTAIRAERSKEGWRLTEPLVYPAQTYEIEHLLGVLERLTPATYITAGELKGHTNADAEFGFKPPRASILVRQDHYEAKLLLGTTTGPGDQLFLQVVGMDGVEVVDAALLKWLPHSANDWRDPMFVNLKGLSYDRVSITNSAKALELQRSGPAHLWRIVTPPLQARADTARLDDLIQKLGGARVTSFVTDDPKADLDSYGLQSPNFQLALGQGTNTILSLAFGKSPTNDPSQVYARRVDQPAIVTVPADLLTPWQASINDFRDPHLVNFTGDIQGVDVRGEEKFSLDRQASNSWRVLPLNVPADTQLVQEFLSTLATMRIVDYTKDAVTAPDLPPFGLANPSRIYILISFPANSTPAVTNPALTELDFGTNRDDKVYVRRPDESSIYAIGIGDYLRLPVAGYQFRERQVWDVPIDDISSVTITQNGKTLQILRKGPYQWSLASGSQGVINELAIEESVRYLCRLSAGVWMAHGQKSLAQYGFRENGHKITLELKKGTKLALEFGAPTPSDSAYAAVTLDGEPWIFEYPPALYRFVGTYLTIAASP